MSEQPGKYELSKFQPGQVWRGDDGNYQILRAEQLLTAIDPWGRVRQFRRAYALEHWHGIWTPPPVHVESGDSLAPYMGTASQSTISVTLR